MSKLIKKNFQLTRRVGPNLFTANVYNVVSVVDARKVIASRDRKRLLHLGMSAKELKAITKSNYIPA